VSGSFCSGSFRLDGVAGVDRDDCYFGGGDFEIEESRREGIGGAASDP
jgi:hypothetical protein